MILLIGSEKGGTGKTTISTNLAVLAARAGADVLLVDTDPTTATTSWSAIPTELAHAPAITCMSKVGPSTGHDIVKMRDKFDHIIVDAGGGDSTELRTTMVIADKMVVPVKPSQFDVWTLSPMERLVYDVTAAVNPNLRPIVCLNLTDPNPALREAQEVLEYLSEFKMLRAARSLIHDRVPFRRAAREGRGVVELDKGENEKAIAEIEALFQEVFDDA